MQEMDIVEVITEKERYSKEGVHKGMQGWICDERCVDGYWLVNIPQYGEKPDIATISIREQDLKQISHMSAKTNERIREAFEEQPL